MSSSEPLTPEAARDALATGKATIVDIRKQPDDRQIPGSVRYDGAALVASEQLPFSGSEQIIVYCGSGNSCQRVAAQLREKGINARALEGGYAAWKAADFPTEPISEKGPSG